MGARSTWVWWGLKKKKVGVGSDRGHQVVWVAEKSMGHAPCDAPYLVASLIVNCLHANHRYLSLMVTGAYGIRIAMKCMPDVC